MQKTSIQLQNIASHTYDNPIDPLKLDNVIFVENSKRLFIVSQIKLSGKYNKVYNVISSFIHLNEYRVLIDDDLLIVVLFSEIAVIDLKQDKLYKHIDLDCYELFRIVKFKSGYILNGEGETRFLDKNFDIVWEYGCGDIFVNHKAKDDFEVCDDYVVAIDWNGFKHYYNEQGLIKQEYCPQYAPKKNTDE